MSADAVHLRAFDEFAGQALFEVDGNWYRATCDDDWIPRELPDRRAAVRCTILAPFGARDDRFSSIVELQSHLRKQWREVFEVEDIPLSEVIHLFRSDLQRHWKRLEDRRIAETNWQRQNSRRDRALWQSESSRPKVRRTISVRPSAAILVPPPIDPEIWNTVWRFARRQARIQFERRFARPVPFDEEDIASLATTSVFKFLQRKPEGRIEHLYRFVAKVVANTCIDSFRKDARSARRPSRELEEVSLDSIVDSRTQTPDEALIAAERRLEIRTAIDAAMNGVSWKVREIGEAVLARLQDEGPRPSLVELSQELGISTKALRSRMFTFRKALAAQLQDLDTQ